MMSKEKFIKERFDQEGISLTDDQVSQFAVYYELLTETNKVMNLTAITQFEEVVEKHFLDSVMIIKQHDFSSIKSLIDVGTGAGFPGMPIKILYPQISVTLLDSLNKRMAFLQKVVDNLNLDHIDLVHGRAEDFGRDPLFREKYDLCVSRAVANLSTLSEYCTPFVKVGGFFVSYKSGNIEEELENAKPGIKRLGCKTKKVEIFTLNSTEAMKKVDDGYKRSFIFIERMEKLDKRYPRKAGIPAKMPLS
ncbi:16S rRNA (guanine(527)-N(7))-methyltransferase RsmG [Qiania dongpingensis]|uniref:Ribosomal RNA small subunit methyltransferase G n=1 Tax=Qiania dongpingensis TaxID=2763669 RepID=A0A7G9G100_9FIRM|nr:16S rRNA (guanine(527)-N(7))-methyltransferase RsmG [Qiania dongpingensis]QNM04482.1 16S rRNA (guanine(527)-N(7))-methyltransferase RsmG [Qiania dongpingensis]